MAVKKKKVVVSKKKKELEVVPEVVEDTRVMNVDDEDRLDPEEEKMLDWILKGVVWFVLGWLALSILLVIGGYFGLWK